MAEDRVTSETVIIANCLNNENESEVTNHVENSDDSMHTCSEGNSPNICHMKGIAICSECVFNGRNEDRSHDTTDNLLKSNEDFDVENSTVGHCTVCGNVKLNIDTPIIDGNSHVAELNSVNLQEANKKFVMESKYSSSSDDSINKPLESDIIVDSDDIIDNNGSPVSEEYKSDDMNDDKCSGSKENSIECLNQSASSDQILAEDSVLSSYNIDDEYGATSKQDYVQSLNGVLTEERSDAMDNIDQQSNASEPSENGNQENSVKISGICATPTSSRPRGRIVAAVNKNESGISINIRKTLIEKFCTSNCNESAEISDTCEEIKSEVEQNEISSRLNDVECKEFNKRSNKSSTNLNSHANGICTAGPSRVVTENEQYQQSVFENLTNTFKTLRDRCQNLIENNEGNETENGDFDIVEVNEGDDEQEPEIVEIGSEEVIPNILLNNSVRRSVSCGTAPVMDNLDGHDDEILVVDDQNGDVEPYDPGHIMVQNDHDYEEDGWVYGDEGSDIEEICTCPVDHDDEEDEAPTNSEDELPSKDVDLSGFTALDTLSDDILKDSNQTTPKAYRKRKASDRRCSVSSQDDGNRSKRLAINSPSMSHILSSPHASTSLIRTPRSHISLKDNGPPELNDWLLQFQKWSNAEKLSAVDRLIDVCEPSQVRYMMQVIEPQFQRDFISLLPRELALQVLSYLDPTDLLRAAQTCHSWRFLCDDNLLWKEKCKEVGIFAEPNTDRPKRGRTRKMPPISSPWKAAYMRQYIIENNWRSRPIRPSKVLKGHDDHVITCLQFCGNRIVSGSDDNTLKVWSAITGKCLRTLVGHTGGVWSSQMSDNVIISGSTDRTLKVWDAETGQCIHTLYGHTSTVRCMHLHGNKVVSGSRDATLRVWDVEAGRCLHILVGHLAAVRCVQYDGKLVVSGAYDYMVKIWNPETQECLHTLQGHTNRVYSLQFDGIHVVSGSLDTSIRVWDAETGSCKHTLMGHQSLTSGMELRSNILVSGNADSTVKVWDITTGQCLQTLSGPNKHQSAVTCLQFNTRFVITSSDDGTVKLWDVKTGEFIRNLIALGSGGSGGVVWRIRASDTKLICAVGSRNGTEETKLMVLDFDVDGACVKCS